MTAIRAAVLDSHPSHGVRAPLTVTTVELDDPLPHEVVVRIQAAGLCHSDLHELDGSVGTTPPIVLGHEAAGIVERVGSAVSDFEPGDFVVSCLSVFCGSCRYCRAGRLVLCAKRSALSHDRGRPRLTDAEGRSVRPTAGIGGFAERMLVHQNALVCLPHNIIRPEVASVLGCAVTTGLGAVFHSAQVSAGEDVVVIGGGGVGLMAVQGARIAGATRVIAVDVQPEKLELAQHLGATHTVDATSSDPIEAVRSLTEGGADHVIEAVGMPRTIDQAVAMLRPGGTATIVGILADDARIELSDPAMFLSEKRLQGSFMGSNRFRTDLPRYVELYRQGRLLLDELITHTVDLATLDRGFELLSTGNVGRVVARMEGSQS